MIARCQISGVLLLSAGVALMSYANAQSPPRNTVTAPATTAPNVAGAGAELGRFFFTPAQRTALDEARRRPHVAAKVEKTLPPAPEVVTLNGVVQRSDGTTTVWLNNKPVRSGETDEGLQVAPSARSGMSGNVTVRVPQTGRVVDLKVGQQVDVTSGRVEEGYRSPRRTEITAESSQPKNESYEPRTLRRPTRERELLRDLIRDMETPPATPATDERRAASAAADSGR